MNKLLYIICSQLLMMNACTFKQNPAIDSSSLSHKDTLRFNRKGKVSNPNGECNKLINSFHIVSGIYLSDYYLVTDSLSLNTDKDGVINKILVLSPLSLEATEVDSCSFELDSMPKRLLVIIAEKNGASQIKGIYSNLVSDIGGVLNSYNGIFTTESGFKIVHKSGAKYSWTYTMDFLVKGGEISLRNISKICSINSVEKSIDYALVKKDLNSIIIADTIKLNCNCDTLWSKIEQEN